MAYLVARSEDEKALLVVIVIRAVLIALLLPAVQKVRREQSPSHRHGSKQARPG